VRELLETYEDQAQFYTADVYFQDAQRYIPVIANKGRLDADLGLSVLDQIDRIVEQVDRGIYEEYQNAARERIALRDPDDWPVVATALLLDLIRYWTCNLAAGIEKPGETSDELKNAGMYIGWLERCLVCNTYLGAVSFHGGADPDGKINRKVSRIEGSVCGILSDRDLAQH
jgi:hypothetical protein